MIVGLSDLFLMGHHIATVVPHKFTPSSLGADSLSSAHLNGCDADFTVAFHVASLSVHNSAKKSWIFLKFS